jgi:hypothetical protein
MAPAGPYRLVTVNTAPDRAKRLIGRVVEDVKEQYDITHAGNAASKHQSSPLLHAHLSLQELTLHSSRHR